MGVRARIREEATDFKRGFNDGFDSDAPLVTSQIVEQTAAAVVGFSRALLYGFLLAFDGVPLLPWGKPLETAGTVTAVLLSSILLGEKERLQLARFVGVTVLFLLVLRAGTPSSTSMLLIGAFVSTAAALASSHPFVYGVVAGAGVLAIAVQVFDWTLVRAPQLPLSTRMWTPDRAGGESLHLAGFLLLTGLIQLFRRDTQRMKDRAAAAEAARDDAVADERARIARELHDVVSHHVTAMTLQAEAAAITGDKQALSSVASAGREALTELRRMLGVLRHAPEGEAGTGDMEPQPGVAQLDRLAERASTGLQVHIVRRGDVRPLPAGVELCVFRLVQEALTNSAKHGDATEVEVVLSYAPDMVTVDIRDNGRPLAAPRVRSSGLGLIGMQERVTLLDGELSTGLRADGRGYQVVARLPLVS